MNIRIRIIACLAILYMMITLILFTGRAENLDHNPEYTAYNQGIATTTGVYFMENWNKYGRIYRINESGDVLNMVSARDIKMDYVHAIEVANDKVYAVYSVNIPLIKEDYKIYRVAIYGPYLEIINASKPFIIDSDERISSIDIIGDAVYVTTVGFNGDKANVYDLTSSIPELDEQGFLTQEAEAEVDQDALNGLKRQTSIVYRTSEGGRFFSEAYYDGETVVISYDTDRLTGKFAPDLSVSSAVSKMHFNLAQLVRLYFNYLSWWIAGLIIMIILTILLMILLRHKNRSVYTFVATEVVYLIMLSGAIFFVKQQFDRSELRQNVRYGVLGANLMYDYMPNLGKTDFSDRDFYESDGYQNMVTALRRFFQSGYNDEIFYDMFLIRTKTGVIAVDVGGFARENASYVYGSAMNDVRQQLMKHSSMAYSTFKIMDENMVAVGIPNADPSIDTAMIVICRETGVYNYLWSDMRYVVLFFVIAFLIGSLIIALIFYVQTRDLAYLEHTMRDVALGRTRIAVPETPAQDMTGMWNSLSEIVKRMEEINYDKFKIFEAYYRFAPKNVETIMGKDSIFDVKNGDTTKVDGTLMLLSSEKGDRIEKRVESLTSVMSYMSRFTEKQEGIMVSQDSALSVLKFFFLDDYMQTVQGATQFLHRNSSDVDAGFVSGFLYNGSFVYGVAGVTSQSLSFITSKNSRVYEEYATWFNDLRIPLVITESVMKRENTGQVRYIGFIMLDGGRRRIDLYEVIDAESAKIRQLKLASRDKFEETLNLVYSKEYYLARNRFSEILKECPEDNLAKWYLFECESYLNSETDPALEGALHIRYDEQEIR